MSSSRISLGKQPYMLVSLMSTSALLLVVFSLSKAFTISEAELREIGYPQPFEDSAEIAAQTGIPLLSHSFIHPDNDNTYERLEQYSNDTDYDHLDAVLWDTLAMVSDIRPTKRLLLQRNYLLYLLGVWLLSLAFAWYHRRWMLLPALFVPCALLVFVRRVQTLFYADYLTQGTVAIAPIFFAAFLIILCELFSRTGGQRLLRWIIILPLFAFFLRYLSVIHSANRSVMLTMAIISLPLFYVRFRPTAIVTLKLLLVIVVGAFSFDAVVEGLRSYRDQRMQFTHPRPTSTNHTTFSLFYYGIGSFDNAIGLYPSDAIWSASSIKNKARQLGVPIWDEEKSLVGGAPKADDLFFRLWRAYVERYPLEYLTNRIQANAWVVARIALRDIYPKLSFPEQVFWCLVGILSWLCIALTMWVFVRFEYPIETIVILLSAYVALALIGILHHPVRGMFAGMPVLLIAATLIVSLVFRLLPLRFVRDEPPGGSTSRSAM